MSRPEQVLQIAVVDAVRLLLPAPCRIWFVPNGGNLSKAQRGLFMRMGLLSGVSDLHVMWPGGFGVMELKAPGKAADTSTNQLLFQHDAEACGHRRAVVDSLEGAIAALRAWGVPLKANVRF